MSVQGTGREPTREKRWLGTYIVVLVIALQLSMACLYFRRQERAGAEAMEAAVLTASVGEEIPWLANGIARTCGIYGEMWRFFIDKIDWAAVHNRDDKYIAGVCSLLFNSDPDIFRVWVILDPDRERGEQSLTVMSERGSGKNGQAFIRDVTQGGYYAAAREKNSVSVSLVTRNKTEPDAEPPSDNAGKQKLALLVYGPVTSGGHFAGAAGFEADLQIVLNVMHDISRTSGLDLFLLDPDGNVAASSSADGRYPDMRRGGYPDAISAIAGKKPAGGGLQTIITGTQANRTFAAFAPVDVGDGGRPWFVAALRGADKAEGAGKGWLFAIVLVWVAAVFAIFIARRAAKCKPAGAEDEQLLAMMPPGTAEIFKKLEFNRKLCYVICALLFIPAIFLLQNFDKRYREAKKSADAGAAEKALSAMNAVTIAAAVIGVIALYFGIRYR